MKSVPKMGDTSCWLGKLEKKLKKILQKNLKNKNPWSDWKETGKNEGEYESWKNCLFLIPRTQTAESSTTLFQIL
jgi:hypothetical protein